MVPVMITSNGAVIQAQPDVNIPLPLSVLASIISAYSNGVPTANSTASVPPTNAAAQSAPVQGVQSAAQVNQSVTPSSTGNVKAQINIASGPNPVVPADPSQATLAVPVGAAPVPPTDMTNQPPVVGGSPAAKAGAAARNDRHHRHHHKNKQSGVSGASGSSSPAADPQSTVPTAAPPSATAPATGTALPNTPPVTGTAPPPNAPPAVGA